MVHKRNKVTICGKMRVMYFQPGHKSWIYACTNVFIAWYIHRYTFAWRYTLPTPHPTSTTALAHSLSAFLFYFLLPEGLSPSTPSPWTPHPRPTPPSDTRCRESPSAWRTEHKKHVHVSFILNNGKPSPRRALASCSSWWSIQKRTLSTVLSKKDVW